ncbi:MAG: hypothetical protein ACYDEO_00010 [Aggregatilineales bacterium]
MATALQTKPTMTLAFYPFGIILHRKLDDGGETEYAVSPAQVAETLCGQVRFESGLLTGNTLYIASEGARKLTLEYRPPTKTALYLDGSETPVVVPLPGLVMGRITIGSDSPRYGVYAVKTRPERADTPLYHAPLPNTGTGGMGSVCWGSVRKVSVEGLASNRLDEDWKLLLGSIFTNHGVGGKSKHHPNDIRQQLIELDKRKARKYPIGDLIPVKATFGELLKEGIR